MLIGQTSSACASRRMLSASRPSASAISSATARMRSFVSRGGAILYAVLYTVQTVGGRSITRSLVWLALAGQAAVVASRIVAGAREAGHSHARSGVSALAARTAEHPWIAIAGMCCLGASLVLL